MHYRTKEGNSTHDRLVSCSDEWYETGMSEKDRQQSTDYFKSRVG